MTNQTPIDRAGNALLRNLAYQAGVAFGVPDETEAEAKHRSEIIKAVMESIDTNQLANVLSTLTTCDGQPHPSELHRRQAQAVKNWLTGNN